LPERVFIPTVYLVVLMNLFYAVWIGQSRWNAVPRSIQNGFIAVLLIIQISVFMKINKQNVVMTNDFNEAIGYLKRDRQSVYILYGSFKHEGMKIFSDPNRYYNDQMIVTAWTIGIPAFDEVLRFHKCSNAIQANADNQDLKIVRMDDGIRDSSTYNQLKCFVNEHYPGKIFVENIQPEFSKLTVVKLSALTN